MQQALSLERVPVSGGELACTRAGPRERTRPALVLLHGWTLDHRMWAPQLTALGADRLVLAPDRRGFGQSSAPPGLIYEPADVVALLDHFDAPAAIIVGMSQSGRTALELALRHSARVAGLVLQGVRFGASDAPEIPVADYARLIRSGKLDDMKQLWRAHGLMRTFADAASRGVEEMLAAYDGRDLLGHAPLAPQPEEIEAARIAAPALIVTGEHDTPGRRAAAAKLLRTLPRAESREISGAGHLCNLDQPEAYNAALRRFLAALS